MSDSNAKTAQPARNKAISPESGEVFLSNLPHLEFRPDSRGEFDEIVARFADGMVHAEMMDDKSCYVGFYWDDGRYCQWWFGTKKGKLWNDHEDGDNPPPRYTAHEIDTRPDEPSFIATKDQTP